MSYVHIDIEKSQSSKHALLPCGDVIHSCRNEHSATIILSDGLGHGIKANIAANMVVARLEELMRSGFTLRHAFGNVVQTMEDARRKDLPYAVFTVARILNDGLTTILSYEMPTPILITRKRDAELVKQRTILVEKGIVGETDFKITNGDAIVLMSDGITQAGLGKGLVNGWESSGVAHYINESLKYGVHFKDLPELIRHEAINKWKGKQEDDCTVVIANTRPGKVLNLFTGPPKNSEQDEEIVERFMDTPGLKIVSGATTAKIVAKVLERELEVEENYTSNIAPMSYYIDGIDLVTEGAVTLNQVYNVWDEDENMLEKDSPVTDLYSLLSVVDRVNLFLGMAENPANSDISFAQQGILNRNKIIPLLTEKLRKDGKLVVTYEF